MVELGDLVGGEVTWAPLGLEQESLLAVGEVGGPLKGEDWPGEMAAESPGSWGSCAD